jgi:hypothetical protein
LWHGHALQWLESPVHVYWPLRLANANSNSNSNSNGNIHAYRDGHRHVYTDINSHGNVYANSHSRCYRDSYCYGYFHADTDANTDLYAFLLHQHGRRHFRARNHQHWHQLR